MKNRFLIRPGGILSWSTALILAGGTASLTSCDNSVRSVMDETSSDAAAKDPVQTQLESGLVTNNFNLPKVGYYHAAVNRFYDTPYNQFRDDQYYVNGEWASVAGPDNVPATRPLPDELKKVDAALEAEQKVAKQQPQNNSGGGGFGMGNALMMYWLLSGSRGFFSPGAGFQQANRQAPMWQRSYQDQRRATSSGGGSSSAFGRSSSSKPSTSSSSASSRGGFGSHGSFSSSS